MKKLIISLIATVAMSSTCFAQDENAQSRQERKQFDPTEMIQKRTEQMVKTYNLTDEQATKVKELNEKYFKNMGPGRGMRGQRPEQGDSLKMKPKKEKKVDGETSASAKTEKSENAEKRQRPQGERRGGPDMTEYNNELKKILTDDQYKAYEQDMEKRRSQMGNRRMGGPRGERGQRPQNEGNSEQ